MYTLTHNIHTPLYQDGTTSRNRPHYTRTAPRNGPSNVQVCGLFCASEQRRGMCARCVCAYVCMRYYLYYLYHIYMYIYIHVYEYTHTHDLVHVWVCVYCAYACVDGFDGSSAWMHDCIVCICEYMYVCVHKCMYVCIHIKASTIDFYVHTHR
jgi:hypothetical protein